MNIVTVESDEKTLRKKCMPITNEKSDYLNKLIDSMIKLMVDSGGCGIAAPQVGVNKRLFLAVLDGEHIGLFVNPSITYRSEEMQDGSEGCLSVPGLCGDVVRHEVIRIKYFNGQKIVEDEFSGMNARIIQHEYDHLYGIIYTDKATNIREREDEVQEDGEEHESNN